ncbi:metal ABC transporter permease [uncultured Tessaracoccus sp.]|uniref:metal ABC transporter permease n=1 Tax=uncultured Tessaracoccus sp. TaxID=905023 RepID=UPI0025D4FB66|nr:metal ABC transporter permease [uncultured Tessaracoccus sp.]
MTLVVALVLLTAVTAATCALPGVFLVVRRQSMLIDAISHAVFPGIVIGALCSGSTHSVSMVVIASGLGVLVAVAAEWLRHARLASADAGQALVFPALFAVGVWLMSTQLSGVHLSERVVLSGELNLLALRSERLVVAGLDLGPQAMWWLLPVLLVDGAFVVGAFRVLEVASFDPMLAATSGMPVRRVQLALMVLTSLTIVAAFQAVGSILVVALMALPAAMARLLVQRLRVMCLLAPLIAVATAMAGLAVATSADLATAPTIALVEGVAFVALVLVRTLRRVVRRRS